MDHSVFALVNRQQQQQQQQQPQNSSWIDPPKADDEKTAVLSIMSACIFSIVLIAISVGTRLFFRKVSKLRILADDYMIIIAAMFAIADAAVFLLCVHLGYGRHMQHVNPINLAKFPKLIFVTLLLYGVAISFVKFSVLFFYRRIFPSCNFKIWLYMMVILSTIWWTVFTMVTFFKCQPVNFNWDKAVKGTCINHINLYIAMQVANILLDITTLALPISAIVGMQMSKLSKACLGGAFTFGGISIVFAIIHVAIMVRDSNQKDITFGVQVSMWSLLESAIEIFSACLLCFTPFVKRGHYTTKNGNPSMNSVSGKLGSNLNGTKSSSTLSSLASFSTGNLENSPNRDYHRNDRLINSTLHPVNGRPPTALIPVLDRVTSRLGPGGVPYV